jgi:hypothetical protein
MNFNNKKYMIIAAAIVVVVIILASIFIGKGKTQIFPAINAVPEKAILIMETDKLPELLTALKDDISLFSLLSQSSLFQSSYKEIFMIDSSFNKNKDLKNFFENRKIIISSHIVSNKENSLILIAPANASDPENLKKILTKFSLKKIQIQSLKYDNAVITSISEVDNSDYKIYYSFYDGYFLLSYSDILLQNSIRRIDSNYSLSKDKNFNELYGFIKSQSIAKIFINYENVLKSSGTSINEKELKRFGFLYNFADWTGLDINIANNKIEMSGYTVTKPDAQYLNIFKEIEPDNTELFKILPKKTSSFLILNIKNGVFFNSKLETYLSEVKKIKQHKAYIDKFYETFKISKKSMDFYSKIGNEIAFVDEDVNKNGINHNSFCFIKITDTDFYPNFFDKINTNFCKANNLNSSNYKKDIIVNDEKYKIFKLHSDIIPLIFFGSIFETLSAQYVTFTDKYLIFGETENALTDLLVSYQTGQSLNEFSDDINLIKSVTDETNIFFYTNIFHNKNIYKKYLNGSYSQKLENDSKIIGKIKGPIIQYISDSYPIYTTVNFETDIAPPNIAETVWETKLDSSLTTTPFIVTNHNTNEKEIFVQDAKNKIYLIDRFGNIIWKRQLSEKIISNVFQIDYFENNKLQLIFNTKSEIHTFDRNGNYVEGYPVKLKSPATNGLTVVDYENNRDYRIFIATENKKVLLLDKTCKLIEGWNFGTTKNTVSKEIKFYSAFGKDYITFNDISNVYIVDRKGEMRVKPITAFPIGKNSEVFFEQREDEKNSRFVITNPEGTLYYIYLDGNVKKMQIEKYSDLHYFSSYDLNGDNNPEYLFTDNNQTDVYNYKKERLFSYTYSDKVLYQPRLFKFSETNNKIGATSLNGKVYLINNDGTILKGFPLIGTSDFRISKMTKDSEFSIIVGGKGNYIYKYNVL